MFLMFGVKSQSESNNKLLPVLNTIFSPDVSVLDQKIVRSAYPNSTMNFLSELLENNGLSELKIYPSSYINNSSAPTLIDPLLQFLANSNIASNIKYKPSSELFSDIINDSIQDIIDEGFKQLKKSNQYEAKVVNRTVKLQSNSSTKLIVGQVNLKLFMNSNMYVSLFQDPDDADETLLDLIMQNLIFFKTTDLSKLSLAYRFKVGVLDIETQEFQSMMTYKPITFNLNLSKKSDTRILQVSLNQFIVNIFDAGITKISDKISKQILINRKQVKINI